MIDLERYVEIPEDESPRRLFAIGDIHGCDAELQVLLDELVENQDLSGDDLVIFIGDYIDRGPNSRGVVDCLLDFQRDFPSTIFLRGNHEDMLLQFLGFEGSEGWAYLQNGGAECLESYSVKFEGDSAALVRAFPKEHISFYLNLQRYVITGKYVFVHAGLDPLRDIYAQINRDIFWIRDEFISNIHHFDRTVIFGHTPFRDLMFHLPYKIGIDTGLVFGNKLSCIDLTENRVLQVEKGARKVSVSSFEKKQATK